MNHANRWLPFGMALVLAFAADAHATLITSTSYFLDEIINTQFSSMASPGLRLHIEAGISDQFGVPGNISSVIARHTTTGRTVPLPYQPIGNFTTPNFGPYYTSPLRSSVPSASRTGSYAISVTNDQSVTVTRTTPFLTTSVPLAHAQNIQTAGNRLSPTVSWSAVPGADRYELRVWNPSTAALLFDSSRSATPRFAIPSGVLSPNQNYAVGILSLDTDTSGNLIRRSFELRPYSTTTPPPPSAQLTTYDFVQFAGAAYRSPSYVAPAGYSLVDSRQNGNIDVRAWVNRDHTQVVIGIGGSEQLDDYTRADSAFVTGRPTANYIDHVRTTVDLLVAMQNAYPNAAIQLTGHSLGGAVAQTVADAAGLKAVTFDAPGAKGFESNHELSDALQPIHRAASADIINYRVYGDLVSTVGSQFGKTFTYAPPIAELIVDTFPAGVFKTLHLLDIIGERVLSSSSQASSEGPTVASVFLSGATLLAVTQVVPAVGVITTGVSGVVFAGSLIAIDPGDFDAYLFEVAADSPAVRSILFPLLLGSEASFDLQVLISGEWASLGLFQELDNFDFGPVGVREFRFFIEDYDTHAPLVGVEDFTFGLTFVEDGQLHATLTSFSSSSPAPEPGSLYLLLLGVTAMCVAPRRRLRRASCS